MQELEFHLTQTLSGIVMLDLYPKSEINITIHILESDGYGNKKNFNETN